MNGLGNFGNNMILIAQDETIKKDKKDITKSKKGDGINAALVLMRQVRDFQDQIQDCIDAQDIEDNKKRIAEFDDYIGKMYETLLDIARGGIRRPENTENTDTTLQPLPSLSTNQLSSGPSENISSLNIPQAPRM